MTGMASEQLRFSPESWRKGGQGYVEEAAALRRSVATHLAALDVNRLGCNSGEHLADIALAVVVPPVRDAFREACENLAVNLEALGAAMQDSGTELADYEADAAATGAQAAEL